MQPDNHMGQLDSQLHTKCYKAWIENGILYHEYEDELTLSGVLAAEKKSLFLLDEHGIHMLPVIICLKHIDKTRFKLTMGDYGRVLSLFDQNRFSIRNNFLLSLHIAIE